MQIFGGSLYTGHLRPLMAVSYLNCLKGIKNALEGEKPQLGLQLGNRDPVAIPSLLTVKEPWGCRIAKW